MMPSAEETLDLSNGDTKMSFDSHLMKFRRTLFVWTLFFWTLVVLHLGATACRAEPESDVRVGAAAVNLEADDDMIIAGGIGPGRASGQEGQLRAVAIVVQDNAGTRVAIVACDVLFTPRDIVDAALKEIQETTEIPPSHVLINATHTHHAPSTIRVHGCEREEVFCQRLRRGIVQAVQQANAKLKEGRSQFFFHLGQEKTVGANSRLLLRDGKIHWIGTRREAVRPTGPFDPELPVLSFRSPAGRLQSVIYNHSTHTIGTRKPGVRSPSFYGLAAQELEQEHGATVCFLEGASGSTHNITGVSTGEAVVRMKRVIEQSLNSAERRPVRRVNAIRRRFVFRVRTFDETVEDEKVVSYVRKYSPTIADKTIGIFREMRRALKPLQGQKRETWIQAILIGDVAIVGVPAEYFTSLGVEIKERSPLADTYVAELANDWIGYLPDREGHRLGGYQTWMGRHSYAEVGTGERMADEVVEMLKELEEPGS